jgi:hypothetical protein
MPTYISDLRGTVGDHFKMGSADLDASGLTAARTFTLPDAAGTIALTTDIPTGTRFIDGGSASSTYTVDQILDGGGAGSF